MGEFYRFTIGPAFTATHPDAVCCKCGGPFVYHEEFVNNPFGMGRSKSITARMNKILWDMDNDIIYHRECV